MPNDAKFKRGQIQKSKRIHRQYQMTVVNITDSIRYNKLTVLNKVHRQYQMTVVNITDSIRYNKLTVLNKVHRQYQI